MNYVQDKQSNQFKSFLLGRIMNHRNMKCYVSVFDSLVFSNKERILDVGCGGGAVLKYIFKKLDHVRCYGLDKSPEMIELSEKVNRKSIKHKRAQFLVGSATDIPGPDNNFSLVLAMESINYWPDAYLGLAEVYRVLQEKGRFLVVNRYPSEKSKWYDRSHYKDTIDYSNGLENAGFKVLSVDIHSIRGWIVILAEKPASDPKK